MSDSEDQAFPGSSGSNKLPRIILEFESFRDFIQAFSPVVSEEGMFVGAERLPEGLPSVGDELEFEVTLTDDFRLVHGRGEVVWVRVAESSDGSAGAAIRFLDLDEPSRRLLTRLLANYAKDGGQPFDLAAAAPAGAVAVEAPVEGEPPAPGEAKELSSTQEEPEQSERVAAEVTAPEAAAEDEAPVEAEGQGVLPTLEPAEVEPRSGAELLFELKPATEAIPDAGREPVPPATPDAGAAEDEADVTAEAGVALPDLETPDQSDDAGDLFAVEPSLPAALSGIEEPAAQAPEPAPSRRVLAEEIEQVAEELSGTHHVAPVEMPSDDDQLSLAGAGRAADERPSWRTPLLVVLVIAVATVAAWYFAGDQIMSFVGSGDGEDQETVAMGVSQPVLPVAGKQATDDQSAAAESGPAADAEVAAGVEVEALEQADEAAEEMAEEVAGTPSPTSPATPVTPVTAVESITWEIGDGETVIAIALDGTVTDGSYEVVRIRQGAPREIIKISGVSRPVRPPQLEVQSAHVVRLRTGVHATAGGSEVHIVADLTGPAVAVTLVRAEGNTLLVTFS